MTQKKKGIINSSGGNKMEDWDYPTSDDDDDDPYGDEEESY